MLHKKVTVCACVSRSFMDKERVAEVTAIMRKKGYEVTVVADLCKEVMTRSADMERIASGMILACHTRAIRSHLDWLGLNNDQLFDLRGNGTSTILSQLSISAQDIEEIPEKETILREIEAFPVENGTDAWYPVLDKTRCIECGKCHDFCLFGVYTIENKQVKVVQPQNCKNNCPACARMCPSKAIIFPKYEKSPINGGTAEEETFNPEEMDNMYRERLQMRLQQRRAGIPLVKKEIP
ncbi:heterodisulfide reductase subunit A-like polyferredoxin [Parabacteroides sp. PFB2-10]|uniref:ferredoxin family protein n=1 Tax=Parabacteroides sp. PFB2-10 TaxID=1742405 RepID=UPI0024753C79|nr:ferredoxin family protein [Parabacteroides sp. PFB2-10]MDH6314049.1 heterodisulfide reductase subunit A-like polyferredoxin [Parabacteroides sp. PFB2-10]